MRSIAFLVFLLAQHGSLPTGPETPEQTCSRECHRKHCDEWTSCAELTEPLRCQAEVNQHEAECIKKCEPPRG
jgi:hypothetical protein